MFNALKHRNFRLYLSGQFVSFIGTWMQQLATSWMVYRMTRSPLWLGISSFSSLVPMFFLGLFAGVIVDRANQRRLLIWTQTLSAIQALALAFLAWTGKATITNLIGLNFLLGIVNALDMPARQAFVVQLISDRRDLPNAIALNSSVMNATRLIGPAIAGGAIAAFGETVCFFLNAVSYIAVLIALLLMKLDDHRKTLRRANESLRQSLASGLHAAIRHAPIRSILIFLSFTSFFGMPYNTLFPALAAQFLSSGAKSLGAITAASGLGALMGALYLARRKSVFRLGRIIGTGAAGFGISLIAISCAQHIPHPFLWMMIWLFAAGFSMMLQLAAGNTVIQTLVDDDKRGRVMSFFSFALIGVAPFGSLLLGWLAERAGLSQSLILNGSLCVAGGAVYLSMTPKLNREVSDAFGPIF